MAQVSLTNVKLAFNTASDAISTTAATSATDGIGIDYTGKEDGRILLLLENSHVSDSINAKVLKGNGLQGTADLTFAIAAGAMKAIVLESGKFVNVSGANKGKIVINGSTNLKAAAIELP